MSTNGLGTWRKHPLVISSLVRFLFRRPAPATAPSPPLRPCKSPGCCPLQERLTSISHHKPTSPKNVGTEVFLRRFPNKMHAGSTIYSTGPRDSSWRWCLFSILVPLEILDSRE
ncbi:hypothetical protein BDV59DRAFT_66359 [Aspergillus ambiguus]|uniref:uncharacterized protein n=1 Tax=Aspergillus ambiguus TaxID=176160 RepID=UPI003CCCEB9D